MSISKEQPAERLARGFVDPANTGNMHTAGLYSSVASPLTLVETCKLQSNRVSLFSYGTGLAASFFSLQIKRDIAPVVKYLHFKHNLDNRNTVTTVEYEAALEL